MKKLEWEQLTTNGRIFAAGWYGGTIEDWQALTPEAREDLAFAGCGCCVAFPTWTDASDCVHTKCLVRRGKLPKIAMVNRQLRGEMYNGWLRFSKDTPTKRANLAKMIVAVRNAARATGIYDIWKLAWQTIVFTGLQS